VSKRHAFGPVLTEAKVPGDFPIGGGVGVYWNGNWYEGRTIAHGKRTTVRVAFVTGGKARESDYSVASLGQVLDHGAVHVAALRIRFLADAQAAGPPPAATPRRGAAAIPSSGPKVTVLGLDKATNAALAAKIEERTGIPAEGGGDWQPAEAERTADQLKADKAAERDASVAVSKATVALAGAERTAEPCELGTSTGWYIKLRVDRPIEQERVSAAAGALASALRKLGYPTTIEDVYPGLDDAELDDGADD
jgi:hypothetical protein